MHPRFYYYAKHRLNFTILSVRHKCTRSDGRCLLENADDPSTRCPAIVRFACRSMRNHYIVSDSSRYITTLNDDEYQNSLRLNKEDVEREVSIILRESERLGRALPYTPSLRLIL